MRSPKRGKEQENEIQDHLFCPTYNISAQLTTVRGTQHFCNSRETLSKMTDKDNKKDSVTIAPQVFALMAAHAGSHPTSPVHGILIGSRNGERVNVADAFPVCHENPTKTIVEMALSLVQSNLEGNKDGHTIVGWFTAPELLHETKPGPVALRIVANMAFAMAGDGEGEPILVVMNNESIVKLLAREVDGEEGGMTASRTIQAFGKDFGMQWMEPIEKLIVTDETRTTKAVVAMIKGESEIRFVNDLVDHWEQGANSEWSSASSLVPFSNKYKSI